MATQCIVHDKADTVGVVDITLRTCSRRLTSAEALGHREFVLTKLYQSA